MSDTEQIDNQEDDNRQRQPSAEVRPSEPPRLYDDVKAEACLRDLQQLVGSNISEQEIVYLNEVGDYLIDKSGSWAVGDEHLNLLASFLANKDNSYAPNVPLLTLQILQSAALKDDFVLILHQDRKEHRIMSYINLMEQLTLAEQEETVKLLCNMCSSPASSNWLMYISEWQDYDGSTTSNSRVCTKAAVHALLNDQLVTLQDVGVSLIYNLSLKNVFDDIASELATAVLQYLHTEIGDEHLKLCLQSMIRFMDINPTDIAALTKMLGPDLSKFSNNKSSEIVQMVEKIQAKLPKIE